MMRVLFLDIDGVLNSEGWNAEHQSEIVQGILIDRAAVGLLARLVQETKAQIMLIFAANRTPLRSKRNPVINFAQVSIKLLALRVSATNPASSPISYIWGVAIPPNPCRVRPVRNMQKRAT